MANYPLLLQGTPPSCYGTPSELFESIAESFVVPVSITGVIRSVDEPSPDQRGNIWARLNPSGSFDALYNYWITGPSGAGWYAKDPYWIGQIAQFDAGPPSSRWHLLDGTDGTVNAGGRALGVAGSGPTLTPRVNGQQVGAETHILTDSQVPPTLINGGGNLLVMGAGVGPNGTLAVPTIPGAAPILSVAGGGQPHTNMQPTIFYSTYRYMGPVYYLAGT